MKIFSQRRISYTSLTPPLYLYSSGMYNPHGNSGIYEVRDWPCRKRIKTPREKKMSKKEKEREFKICLMKAEIELSKRKVKTMLDEFVTEATTKALETL